ncbi:MAG: glycosyltransferase family 4 protein [Syntrophobacterales bacterium]|nr:glycosyltransferase family 4 protein [Syntrophobacterales bacterium]
MKILFVTPEYPYLEPSGGIASYVQDIAAVMADQGHDVKVLCSTELPGEFPTVHVVQEEQTEIHFISKRKARWLARLTRAPFLKNLLRTILPDPGPLIAPLAVFLHWLALKKQWLPDIIEGFDWQATGLFIALCKGDIPFVFRGGGHGKAVLTRNNISWTPYLESQHRLERWYAKHSSLLVPCSALLGQDEMKDFQIPQEKIVPVPNCVSPLALSQSTAQHQDRGEKLKAVFVGRLEFRKGIDLFIKAAQNLFPCYPGVEYHCIGRVDIGPSSLLEKTIHADLFKKNIHITGPLPRQKVYEYLSYCDFAVFPSRYEPFGTVAIEAMALGLPVIVSDAGGWREAVEDGVSGFICKADDEKNLREKMELMIKMTPGQRNVMGERGRKIVEQNYTSNAISNRMIEIYHGLLRQE